MPTITSTNCAKPDYKAIYCHIVAASGAWSPKQAILACPPSGFQVCEHRAQRRRNGGCVRHAQPPVCRRTELFVLACSCSKRCEYFVHEAAAALRGVRESDAHGVKHTYVSAIYGNSQSSGTAAQQACTTPRLAIPFRSTCP